MIASSERDRSLAEWVTLLLSTLVVGALVAVALVEASRQGDRDRGAIEVTFDKERAVSRGASFYVPYTVRNTGSEAIASAEIWIEVLSGEELLEAAEVSVQSLPMHGQQDGIFVTAHDPDSATLRGRLESLQFP
jgi:uncharacterized protein (TIGR02588 family)